MLITDKLQLEALKLLSQYKLSEVNSMLSSNYASITSSKELSSFISTLDDLATALGQIELDIDLLEAKLPPKQVFTADDIPF
jgi:hypothetical protein